MDVTEHPTETGKAYLAVVLDAFSRRVVGWSIADHMRSELVVDALQMAIWRRRPPLDRPLPIGSRVDLHVVGLRPAPARQRSPRLHGIDR